MTELDAVRVVEAALFSAGKPMLDTELAEATGMGLKEVVAALKALSKEYAERDTSLEVSKAGTKWAMQIRGRYSDKARKLARMEIPGKVLKTLALIAFHQPIKQSELKDMVGSVVYDHVKELHDRGMIVTRQDGITKVLTTSPRFPEYFGLDASERDELRVLLAQRVGIDPAKLRAERGPQTQLPQGQEEASAGQTEGQESEPGGPETQDPEGEASDATGAEALKATTS